MLNPWSFERMVWRVRAHVVLPEPCGPVIARMYGVLVVLRWVFTFGRMADRTGERVSDEIGDILICDAIENPGIMLCTWHIDSKTTVIMAAVISFFNS